MRDSGIQTSTNSPRISQLSQNLIDEGPPRLSDEGSHRLSDEGPHRLSDKGPHRLSDKGPHRLSGEGPHRLSGEGPHRLSCIGAEPTDDRSQSEEDDPQNHDVTRTMAPLHDKGYVPGAEEDTLITGKTSSSRNAVGKTRVRPLSHVTASEHTSSAAIATESDYNNVDVMHYPEDDQYLSVEPEPSQIYEFRFTVDSQGVNFYDDTINVAGSIPENALPEGQTKEICILQAAPALYQGDLVQSTQFVSNIYHFLPHSTKFSSQIFVRFKHNGTSKPSCHSDCMIKIKVLYSNTAPEESPEWVEVKGQRITGTQKDVVATVTNDEVFLSLRSFCVFAAVAEEVPTKYVEACVYGRSFPSGLVKLTVIIGETDDHQVQITNNGNTVDHGKFLDIQSVLLVKDVEDVKVKISNIRQSWALDSQSEEEWNFRTHYIWNGRKCTAVFLLQSETSDSLESTGIAGFVSANISIYHEDTINILVADEAEMMISNKATSVSTGTAQPSTQFMPQYGQPIHSNPASYPGSSQVPPWSSHSNGPFNTRDGVYGAPYDIHNSNNGLNQRIAFTPQNGPTVIRNTMRPFAKVHPPRLDIQYANQSGNIPTENVDMCASTTNQTNQSSDLPKVRDLPVGIPAPSTSSGGSCVVKRVERIGPQLKPMNFHTGDKPGETEHQKQDLRSKSAAASYQHSIPSTEVQSESVPIMHTPSTCTNTNESLTEDLLLKRDVRPKERGPTVNSRSVNVSPLVANAGINPQKYSEQITTGIVTPCADNIQSVVDKREDSIPKCSYQIVNHFHCILQQTGPANMLAAVPRSKLRQPKLRQEIKIELIRKLDVEMIIGGDWRHLADKMGYGAFVETIRNRGKTQYLLDVWETSDEPEGSLKTLIKHLEDIGRVDVARVVQNVVKSNDKDSK